MTGPRSNTVYIETGTLLPVSVVSDPGETLSLDAKYLRALLLHDAVSRSCSGTWHSACPFVSKGKRLARTQSNRDLSSAQAMSQDHAFGARLSVSSFTRSPNLVTSIGWTADAQPWVWDMQP